MTALLRAIRRALDFLYLACGVTAAAALVLMLAIIVLQMAARWTGQTFPGSTDYAGYAMATASFLALAYTLNHGAHIRVSLLLSKLGRWRRVGELWCYGIGTALATYFSYYAIKATYWSYTLNDISQGQDATPIWIPQIAMAVGTTVFAIALLDQFIRLLAGGEPPGVAEALAKRTA